MTIQSGEQTSGTLYVPSTSTELSSGGTQDSCIEFAVQLMTRRLEGIAGVDDTVYSVMTSDLDDMMNVLLQCSFAVTHQSLCCYNHDLFSYDCMYNYCM